MSGGKNEERPPLGTGGVQEDNVGDRDPCKVKEDIPANGGTGDQNCLLSFLRVWSPLGPWWPTAIPREGGGTATATITTPAQMAAWADARRGVDNLYFHVNDLSPNTRKKGDKGDVTRIRGFHVDIDPRPPEGGWPKDPSPERLVELAAHCVAEHARIGRDVVSDKFWASKGLKRPTAIIDSGGGFQCFWLLHDDEVVAPDAAEAVNRTLAALLDGDDAVVDVSRIMRLPGAVNLASQKKRDRGRVDSPTLLVEADGSRRFRAGDFPAPAVTVAPAAAPAAGARVALSSDLPAVDLSALPLDDKWRAIIVQGKDPENPGRWSSRSHALWAVTCQMVRDGCTDDAIAAVILDPDYKISGHVYAQNTKPRKYVARQIERARAEVAKDGAAGDNPKAGMQKDDNGNVKRNQHNIRQAMVNLGVSVRRDTFAGRTVIEGLDGFGPALDDGAVDRLWLLAEERCGVHAAFPEFFRKVLEDLAQRNRFDPVAEWLDSLTWDGVPRLDNWLTAYGGADDTAYTRAVGALLLVAAVRRVRKPGAKFDEMLVLQSSTQGTDKSSAIKALAGGDDLFLDELPLNVKASEVLELTEGKWIVEVAELKGMRKNDIEHLKAFLSKTSDKGRRAYRRDPVEVPRRFVFFGTTNEEKFLRDTTGNRRFWPVRVVQFDVAAIRRDRDQLWAEASVREAEGVPIRLDKALWGAAGAEQDDRMVEDPIFERLSDLLGGDAPARIAASTVWELLGKVQGQATQDDNNRVGGAMRRLDFKGEKVRVGLPQPVNGYVRGKGGPLLVVKREGDFGTITGVEARS